MENQTVVADLYQLMRNNDKFDLDMKKIHRKGVKVSRQFVEAYNADKAWEHSGKIYIIDDKATKQYHEDATVLRDIRKEKDKTIADAAEITRNAVTKSKLK